MKKKIKTTRQDYIFLIGKFLGYPNCCCKEFFESNNRDLRSKASCIRGKPTGFIPCEKHAKLILSKKIKIKDLIKDRKADKPFPNAEKGKNFDEFCKPMDTDKDDCGVISSPYVYVDKEVLNTK